MTRKLEEPSRLMSNIDGAPAILRHVRNEGDEEGGAAGEGPGRHLYTIDLPEMNQYELGLLGQVLMARFGHLLSNRQS